MCGIAGIFDLNGVREIDRAALQRMTNALIHRGPDGEGYYFAPGVAFGHRRLAIIDRAGGVQPYHAQTRDCVLSYNGEIYNYEDLARGMRADVNLKTRSDTEVLAEGLARKGADFIHELRGMFAFSFWSPGDNRLLLARDRLGERPLYYAQTADGYLVFASEMGALVDSGMIETSLDPRAVADYFYYGYTPDPKTIYRGVYKLPAAHTLIAERGRALRIEPYWRPVFTNGAAPAFEDACALMRERLDEAVSGQMMSDAPLGAFLSGGVDSASVVSSMARAGGDLIACTVGFDEETHDERPAAREIAEKFGAAHYESTAACDAAALIERIAAAFGEPFADSSSLPAFLVAQNARRHVTVALSGDGGDEIFAGYRRYPFYLGEEKLRAAAPLLLRQMVFGTAGALYPKLDWAPKPLRFKTTFQALAQTGAAGYAAAVAINLPERVSAILNSDFKRSLDGYNPAMVIAGVMDEADTDDPLARAQYADIKTWLPGRMLTKTDRTSMAHSLEVRPPLLDHKLVEWAGSLPSAYKLNDGERKRILKAAFAPRLGEEFIARKKQGFAPPLTQWMRRERNNPVFRLNASRRWRESGLFNERAVDRMIRAHQSGRSDCAQELWSVIMFDAFLKTSAR
ncbi:asparagine synthase (glutamine-hydrolyzing) [Hyphococcus sp.]|uniref:asparagine synthase (glutamine-hydrolyzing) n=1 Tax=Hyphococcus sp. TaxID=2038636 RepID=UPI003CCC25DB